MALKTLRLTKEEMNSRVARFQELKRFDGGLPDRENLESIRSFFNIIGFRPPKNHDPTPFPQVGEQAGASATIKTSEGSNLAYCKAKPGKGPMMHNR